MYRLENLEKKGNSKRKQLLELFPLPTIKAFSEFLSVAIQ